MKQIRVALVDDHKIVRQGLRSILDPDPEFVVVGEASNSAEALPIIAEHQPDVVLLDLKMPDTEGVALCERITQEFPGTVVLILTAFMDRDLVNACFQAGARGYLLKDVENLNLREQLRAVVQGHAALDPRAAGVLADIVQQKGQQSDALRPREIEVLRLVSQGLTNKEIGDALFLSEHTIKGYVKEIMIKLNARNRIEAVFIARQRNLT